MEQETKLEKGLPEVDQEPKASQPSQEEMVNLLSQTVINQDKQLKALRADHEQLFEEYNLTKKALAESKEAKDKLEAILAKQNEECSCDKCMPAPPSREEFIREYLVDELKYAEAKVQELRHHLADYPEDNYSKVDLQNCLLHINYLKAAIRRINLYW